MCKLSSCHLVRHVHLWWKMTNLEVSIEWNMYWAAKIWHVLCSVFQTRTSGSYLFWVSGGIGEPTKPAHLSAHTFRLAHLRTCFLHRWMARRPTPIGGLLSCAHLLRLGGPGAALGVATPPPIDPDRWAGRRLAAASSPGRIWSRRIRVFFCCSQQEPFSWLMIRLRVKGGG